MLQKQLNKAKLAFHYYFCLHLLHKITTINKQNKSYILITKSIISAIYPWKNINNSNKSHILQMSSAFIQLIYID